MNNWFIFVYIFFNRLDSHPYLCPLTILLLLTIGFYFELLLPQIFVLLPTTTPLFYLNHYRARDTALIHYINLRTSIFNWRGEPTLWSDCLILRPSSLVWKSISFHSCLTFFSFCFWVARVGYCSFKKLNDPHPQLFSFPLYSLNPVSPVTNKCRKSINY